MDTQVASPHSRPQCGPLCAFPPLRTARAHVALRTRCARRGCALRAGDRSALRAGRPHCGPHAARTLLFYHPQC